VTRRDWISWSLLILVTTLLITGFVSAASQRQQQESSVAQPLVDLARADLAARLQVSPGSIIVRTVQPTEFSDSSLGVPEPGQSYLTVITPGYVIELVSRGQMYKYHGAGNQVVLAE